MVNVKFVDKKTKAVEKDVIPKKNVWDYLKIALNKEGKISVDSDSKKYFYTLEVERFILYLYCTRRVFWDIYLDVYEFDGAIKGGF